MVTGDSDRNVGRDDKRLTATLGKPSVVQVRWSTVVGIALALVALAAALLLGAKLALHLPSAWLTAGMLVALLFSVPMATLIDERRKANARTQLFARIVEQADQPIFITNQRGLIEYVNRAFTELTGYAEEEALGRNPSQLLKSNVQDPGFYRELWETIGSGNTWSGHLIDRKKDGSLFPADITITPIENGKGRVEHYVALLRDDSEGQLLIEKQAQEKKMQSLAVAVGGIAHEFNNILAGIMGNAYLVGTIEKDQPEITGMLNTIEELGNQAAGMVRQMLTYAGQAPMRMAPTDLGALVREAVAPETGLVPESVGVHAKIPDDPMQVNGDAAQLQNVLRHLISNACDAMAGVDTPRLSILLEQVAVGTPDTPAAEHHPAQQFARISVLDNGSGIAPEHRELLFEPFFTTKDVGKGTGLGLAAIHGIVQKHEGYIEVESEPGEGSEFRVLLPLLKV